MSKFIEAMDEKQAEIHQLAKTKGWYETTRTPVEMHMLFVSEIAEATEAVRNGEKPIHYKIIDGIMSKPDGELVELADAVIRIMDYFAAQGVSLADTIELKHEFNKTRPHRHGGKKL